MVALQPAHAGPGGPVCHPRWVALDPNQKPPYDNIINRIITMPSRRPAKIFIKAKIIRWFSDQCGAKIIN